MAKRYTSDNLHKTLSKPYLLYFFVIPFVLGVVSALLLFNIYAFVLNMGALIGYLGVLYLSKKGFAQEYDYVNAVVAKAPKTPYKLYSALLLLIVVFYVAFLISNKTLLSAIFLSLIAFVGYYLYYGFDPKDDKMGDLGDISEEFFFDTINEAKTKLASIKEKVPYIRHESLHMKVENAVLISQKIITTIEEDPKDIRVARKFLMVYLDGIKDVLSSYAELEHDDISDAIHTKLEDLFDDIQTKFDQELQRLKNNNQFDLDVNIETLRQQIHT